MYQTGADTTVKAVRERALNLTNRAYEERQESLNHGIRALVEEKFERYTDCSKRIMATDSTIFKGANIEAQPCNHEMDIAMLVKHTNMTTNEAR